MVAYTKGSVTQTFASNKHWAHQLGTGHLGEDRGVNVGTPVVAVQDMVVKWANWGHLMGANPWSFIPGSDRSGILVVGEHPVYGKMTDYCHLSRTDLNPGAVVKAGQIIGYSGNTGFSFGPHVHHECVEMATVGRSPYWGRINPVPFYTMSTVLPATNRQAGPAGTVQRSAAMATATIVRKIGGGGVEIFAGYVRGQQINSGGINSAIWFVDKGENGKLRYSWAGGYTSQATTGLPDLTPVPVVTLKPNQRKVGPAGGWQRSKPTTQGTEMIRHMDPNSTENLIGWIRGEKLTVGGISTDVWFTDSQGASWSGLFTSQATAGLVDQNAKEPTRKTGPAPVRVRVAPYLDAKIAQVDLKPNTTYVMKGYALGDVHAGERVWYQLKNGAWAHSSLFTVQSTVGIPQALVVPSDPSPAPVFRAPPAVAIPARRNVGEGGITVRAQADKNSLSLQSVAVGALVTPLGYVVGTDPYGTGNTVWLKLKVGDVEGYAWSGGFTNVTTVGLTEIPYTVPVTPAYQFTLDFAEIDGLPVKYRPAHLSNVDIGNFPTKPTSIVHHWWNDPALKPSYASVLGEFTRANSFKSPHFMVDDDGVTQNVSLDDRAYHASTAGNVMVGIEISPNITERGYRFVRALVAALWKHYGYELEGTLHKLVPGNNTQCAGWDVARFKPTIAEVPGIPDFIETSPEERVGIKKFLEWSLGKLTGTKA